MLDVSNTSQPANTSRPGIFAPLCLVLLRCFGWRIVFRWPPAPKAVIIFYPHTSNWDFVLGIITRYALGFPVHWAGKDSLFRRPFNGFFRRLGGIPVNRRQSSGLVGQLCAEFERNAKFYLAIAPEGTRKKTDHWKSGFYRVALAAKVPLGLGFVDYGKREIGVDRYLSLSGDEAEDLSRIRAYYADKRGKFPDTASDIRFT